MIKIEEKCVLRATGITKDFPGTRALEDVDFDLLEGEVHALVGENGAGKSTLMNILMGIYQAKDRAGKKSRRCPALRRGAGSSGVKSDTGTLCG